jgi:membrane peptidoglycan carboxypeptidase
MHSIGTITDKQYDDAKNSELNVIPLKIDVSDAPYLVDYIRDELRKSFSEEDITNSSLRVYTSLDPALQKIAVESVLNGLKLVEEQIAEQKKRKKNDNLPGPSAYRRDQSHGRRKRLCNKPAQPHRSGFKAARFDLQTDCLYRCIGNRF